MALTPQDGDPGQISADGKSALVKFPIPESDKVEPTEKVPAALAQVAAVQRSTPACGSKRSATRAANGRLRQPRRRLLQGRDDLAAGHAADPVVVFGSLLAAGVPLLLALTAVGATIGLLGPVSHLFGAVAEQINSVVLLIGLAVGVDYSMFYLRREREERAAGTASGPRWKRRRRPRDGRSSSPASP